MRQRHPTHHHAIIADASMRYDAGCYSLEVRNALKYTVTKGTIWLGCPAVHLPTSQLIRQVNPDK